MNEVIIPKQDLSKEISRREILEFEKSLSKVEGVVKGDTEQCPLKHSFSDGIYVREIFIPKDSVIVGKIHKHEHPNFLMKGDVLVFTESGGEELIKAPCSMISEAGTKRVLLALTDLVWITIHENPTNTRDIEELENMIIAKTFEEFDEFILKQDNAINRLKRFIFKKLNRR